MIDPHDGDCTCPACGDDYDPLDDDVMAGPSVVPARRVRVGNRIALPEAFHSLSRGGEVVDIIDTGITVDVCVREHVARLRVWVTLKPEQRVRVL